jgi:hypothetical protein
VEGGMGFIFSFIIIYKKFGFFLKTLEREGGHGFYFFIFLKKNWRRKMEC